MATKKIEILENTLLKLLVRRGIDVDRQSIVLSEGELGYTTDTKKLYIGDGSTTGGILVGNKFLGEASDHTTFTEAGVGDLAFNNTTNKLYAKTTSSWLEIGGVYSSGDSSIVVDGNNQITVGTLSAGNVAADLLGNSIELDTNNRVSLSGAGISTDSIVSRNGGYLKLPEKLSINNVNYDWPAGGTGSNLFLQTNTNGNLSWAPATAPSTFFFNSTGGPIPVGTIMPYVSANGAPYGWLLCNGQEVAGSAYPVLSTVIGESFGSSTPGTKFKVPNYNNSALYGVNSDPATSTTFSIASGTNSALSAQGSLFIIKAIPDDLVQSTLTVNNSLSATVNNVTQTGVSVSPLSGDIVISLPEFYDSTQTIKGGTSFDLDQYGRVTSVNLSSTTGNTHPAGEITTIPQESTEVVNETSSIVFFKQPATITSTFSNTTISAFPYITNDAGANQSISVASDAKYIILQGRSFITGNGENNCTAYASLNSSLSGTTPPSGPDPGGSNEYQIHFAYGANKDDDHSSTSQTFIPLSAAPNGSLGFFIRYYKNGDSGNTLTIKAIGYSR